MHVYDYVRALQIYSKKVQYLYNLTNETHDYILHRK